jgi:hypothetical protein
MKFTTALLVSGLVLMFGAAAIAEQTPATAPATQPAAAAEEFVLTVKFDGLFTNAEMKTPVKLGEIFKEKSNEPKDGLTYISGVLFPAADGNYTLYFNYVEWASSKSNEIGGTKMLIKLDEPQGGGSNTGGQTITLTRAKPAAK